jgi:hypothetical protein
LHRFGEIDGGDLYNESRELEGVPIHAILTDGQTFEFYICDFSKWRISRGIGTAMEGIPFHNEYQICLPASERDPGYLAQLKTIVEVIFDIFIQSYVNAVYSKRAFSERRAIIERGELGESYVPRKSMDFWVMAYNLGTQALTCLREAHYNRSVDVEMAEARAEEGLAILESSVKTIPMSDTDWSLLDNWDVRMAALLRV